MLGDYLPLFIFLLLSILFAGAVIILSSLVGKKTVTREKLMTYECGLDPVGNARKRFSVKFFIIAMLFIVRRYFCIHGQLSLSSLINLKPLSFLRCLFLLVSYSLALFMFGRRGLWNGNRKLFW
jgi:NADH-quinone oxidoreductase subunit A